MVASIGVVASPAQRVEALGLPGPVDMEAVISSSNSRMMSENPSFPHRHRSRHDKMHTGLRSWTAGALVALVAVSLVVGVAEAGDLRIAAWNLEHLNDRDGEGCVERSDEDFDAIARRIEALDAGVVAFQEVENEAAARRVFNPARWNIVMSSRPETGEGPTCYNRPEGGLQHQGTGIAVRRSVAYRRGDDLSSLAGGNPYLRWGTHIVVGRGARASSTCFPCTSSPGAGARARTSRGARACTVLRSQMNALRTWIDERERKGERFVIAGDFNRRLAIQGDWAWGVLSARGPLHRTRHRRESLALRFQVPGLHRPPRPRRSPVARSRERARSARSHATRRTPIIARSRPRSRTARRGPMGRGSRSRHGPRRSHGRAPTS